MNIKKLTKLSLMLALSLIFSYVEFLVPLPISVPGIKLGLANGVTVYVLYTYGLREAFSVGFLRIVLSMLLFGNPFSFMFSVTGFLFSIFTMYFIKKTRKFSIYGVSVSGAVFHNLGQLIMAFLLTSVSGIFYYVSALTLAAIVTGLLNGYLSNLIIKRVKND